MDSPALAVRAPWTTYLRRSTLVFWGFHVTALAGVIYLGWSWTGVALALGTYFVRMVFVTADGSLSAQFEHTVLVTREGCEILTPPPAP